MNAKEFMKNHPNVEFWNIFRFNEETANWDMIEPCEIEEEETVDESFFNSVFADNDECDLYLL